MIATKEETAMIRAMLERSVRALRWRYIAALYGDAPIGIVSSAADRREPCEIVATLTESSWAGGVWAGALDQACDCIAESTLLNLQTPLVVTRVDILAREITMRGNATDLTAIKHEVGRSLHRIILRCARVRA